MADTAYLKRRRAGWYFQVAVPRELRGKEPWVQKPVIIKSLGTRDLTTAQKKRWPLLAEYQEAFRRASGDIALTRAEINEEAWRIYQQTLRDLEAKTVTADPEAEESPEEAALALNAADFDEALQQEDYEIVARDIKRVAERTGQVITEGSETWDLLGAAICKAKLAALTGRLAALREEPSEPPASFVPGGIDRVTLKPVAMLPKAKIVGKDGLRFSDAIAGYFADKQRDPSAALIGQSEHQYRMTFRLFEEFTHNAPVAAIDREVADAFIDALGKLPPNWGKSKETRDKSLAEILEQSAKSETFISNKTLNRHVSAMSSLFKWMQRKPAFAFTGDNPFANQWRDEASTGATRWLPYKVEELNKLFAGKPPHELRWIMLVALFSGMRLNEVCQLRVSDVQKEQGVHYFNVGAEHDGQRVKSEAGFRRVPVHSRLIKAGLLTYTKALKAGQLWPGLKPGGPDRKLSWYVTRQFTVYRRKVGVTRARVNFHSLRKNFVTALDNADGVSQGDVAALVGHERGFTFDRYSEGKGLPALKAVIERVEYPGLRLDRSVAE